ncbi:MAG: DUF456 family protein [Planctomycetota bacterium]|nr:DUF456 family protein [Planctomycetota bacterium]
MSWTLVGGWTELVAFAIVAAACGALVLVGIPGIWIMVLLAVVIDVAHLIWAPSEEMFFGVWPLAISVVLALGAEGVELLAGGAGAKVGGASKGGMLGAVVGSLIGALIGTCAIPLPAFGTLLGAVGGAAVGAMVGEMVGARRSVRESLVPAAGAAAGRILGFLVKAPFAVAVWVVLVVAAAMQLL